MRAYKETTVLFLLIAALFGAASPRGSADLLPSDFRDAVGDVAVQPVAADHAGVRTLEADFIGANVCSSHQGDAEKGLAGAAQVRAWETLRAQFLTVTDPGLEARVRETGRLLNIPSRKIDSELVPGYRAARAAMLERGAAWRDGRFVSPDGTPCVPSAGSGPQPGTPPGEAVGVPVKDLELLDGIQTLARTDPEEALRRLDALYQGLARDNELLADGGQPLQEKLARIQQAYAKLPKSYQKRAAEKAKVLDRQLKELLARKSEVRPLVEASAGGAVPEAGASLSGQMIPFYAALSALPLTSEWASGRLFRLQAEAALKNNPDVKSYRIGNSDPRGRPRVGVYLTLKDGSRRYEGLDGASVLTSADGRREIAADPKRGTYALTADKKEVLSYARNPGTGGLEGKFHGMAFKAGKGETLLQSPDGRRLSVVKGYDGKGEPKVTHWLDADGSRGQALPGGAGEAAKYRDGAGAHSLVRFDPALLKRKSLSLAMAPQEYLDAELRGKYEGFLRDLPQLGAWFADAMSGKAGSVGAFYIQDRRLYLTFAAAAGKSSEGDQLVASYDGAARELKAFLFSGGSVFMWKFNAAGTVCDLYTSAAEAAVSGRTAFEFRRRMEKKGTHWSVTRAQPVKLKEWTAVDDLKALGGGALAGLGEGTGILFSPFQSGLYYIEAGISRALGRVMTKNELGAFSTVSGVYTERQAKFSDWAGRGITDEKSMLAVYRAAMSKLKGNPAGAGTVKAFLDGEVEKVRRRRYGDAELYALHEREPITELERASAAAGIFGLGNMAGQYMEMGRESWEKGDRLRGGLRYGAAMAVIGGEMHVQGLGFGLAAQPLKMLAVGSKTGLTAAQVANAVNKSKIAAAGVKGGGLTASEASAVRMLGAMGRAETTFFMAPVIPSVGSSGAAYYKALSGGDTEGSWDNFHALFSEISGFSGMGAGLIQARITGLAAARQRAARARDAKPAAGAPAGQPREAGGGRPAAEPAPAPETARSETPRQAAVPAKDAAAGAAQTGAGPKAAAAGTKGTPEKAQKAGAAALNIKIIPLQNLKTWINFGSISNGALTPDPAVAEFAGKVLMKMQQAPEGREVLRELQQEYAANGTKLVIVAKDFKGTKGVLNSGFEEISGIRGVSNIKNHTYSFNLKHMQFTDNSVALELMCANMAHELRHLVSAAQIQRLAPGSSTAFYRALVDEQRARLTGYLVAARIFSGRSTLYVREGKSAATDLEKFWDDLRSRPSYVDMLTINEMKDPINAYSTKMDRLKEEYIKTAKQVQDTPKIDAQLQILEEKEGLKVQLSEVHSQETGFRTVLPVSLKRYREQQSEIRELLKRLASPKGAKLVKEFQTLASDPVFQEILSKFNRDERSLSDLMLQIPDISASPSGQSSSGLLNWHEFYAAVKKSQLEHPDYWSDYWKKFGQSQDIPVQDGILSGKEPTQAAEGAAQSAVPKSAAGFNGILGSIKGYSLRLFGTKEQVSPPESKGDPVKAGATAAEAQKPATPGIKPRVLSDNKPLYEWSLAEQAEVGEYFARDAEVSKGFLRDKKTQAYVEGIVEKVNKAVGYTDHPLKVHILLDNTKNACVIVGGQVLVNVGLLRSVRFEDELAAVIGHELTHLKRRHVIKTARDKAELTKEANAIVAEIMSPRYSQEMEFEADQYGVKAAVSAGYNPLGMVSYLNANFVPEWLAYVKKRDVAINTNTFSSVSQEKKQKIKKALIFVDDWAKSHPSASERVQRVLRLFDDRQELMEREPVGLQPFMLPEQWLAKQSGTFEAKLKNFIGRFPPSEAEHSQSMRGDNYRDKLLIQFLARYAKTDAQLKSGIAQVRAYDPAVFAAYINKGMSLSGLPIVSGTGWKTAEPPLARANVREVVERLRDLAAGWPKDKVRAMADEVTERIIKDSGDYPGLWDLDAKVVSQLLKGQRSLRELDIIAAYSFRAPGLLLGEGTPLYAMADYAAERFSPSETGFQTRLGYLARFLTVIGAKEDDFFYTFSNARSNLTRESAVEFFSALPAGINRSGLMARSVYLYRAWLKTAKDYARDERNLARLSKESQRTRAETLRMFGKRFEDAVSFLTELDPAASPERDRALLGYGWQAHPWHSTLSAREVLAVTRKYLTGPALRQMELLAAKDFKGPAEARAAALEMLYSQGTLDVHLFYSILDFSRMSSPAEAAAIAGFAAAHKFRNAPLDHFDKNMEPVFDDGGLWPYARGQKNRMRGKDPAKGGVADSIREFGTILEAATKDSRARGEVMEFALLNKANKNFGVFVDRVLAGDPTRSQLEEIFDMAERTKTAFPSSAQFLARRYVDLLLAEGLPLQETLAAVTSMENKLVSGSLRGKPDDGVFTLTKLAASSLDYRTKTVRPVHFEHLRLEILAKQGKTAQDAQLAINSMQPSVTSRNNRARAGLMGYEKALKEGKLSGDADRHLRALTELMPEPSASRDYALGLALDAHPEWPRAEAAVFERRYHDFDKQAARAAFNYEADLKNRQGEIAGWSFERLLGHLQEFFPEGSRVRDRYLTALMDDRASTPGETARAKALLFDNLSRKQREETLYFKNHEGMLRPENRSRAFGAVTAGTLAKALISYFTDKNSDLSGYPPEVRNIIRDLDKLDPVDKEKLIYTSLTGLRKSVKNAGEGGGVFSIVGERRQLVDSVMDSFLGGGSDDFVNWFVKETLMELPEHRAARILASMFTAKAQNLSKSEMIALFMERAGIMTTKAAQILSTRPDLVPDEADRQALARLKSGTNIPLDKDYLLGMRRDTLGSGAEKLVFQKQLGTASTRGAYLVKNGRNGVEVLKAFRSDMMQAVTEDLFTYDRIISKLEQDAGLRDKFGIADPRGEFQQIRIGLLEESDSVQEAANARRLQKRLNLLGDDKVRTTAVTEVSRNFVREELSPGLPVENAIKKYGLDPRKTASKIAETVLAQVLRGGKVPVFHADPHSGNIFADAQGNIYFIDRGLVGSLTPNTREAVFGLLRAINGKNAGAAAGALLRLRINGGDPAALKSGLAAKAGELFAANSPPAEAVLMLVSEAKKLGMGMPRDVFTMAKTFYTMDGVVRDLGATVDYEGIITREYMRNMAGRPMEWLKSLWSGPEKQALPPPMGPEKSASEPEWREAVNKAASAYKLSPRAQRLISEAFTESALMSSRSKTITSKRAFDALSLAYMRLEDSRYENTAADRAVLLEILKQDLLQDFARGGCSDPVSFVNAVTEPGIFKDVTERARQTISAAFPRK